ncbi:hypothetical protein [Qipengyuania gaetbuli]|uniref:hypothetical protein n=1 Tax=Qipengyuania gaetbuli TaxID=266952 RepID=UPI001CFE43AA|nr:hypothetical protein [Qipengyuania gaetbuli]
MAGYYDDPAVQRAQQRIKTYIESVYGTATHRLCPACGQGTLVPAEIVATGEKIIFCEECDVLWRSGDPIDEANCHSFFTFKSADGEIGLQLTKIRIF